MRNTSSMSLEHMGYLWFVKKLRKCCFWFGIYQKRFVIHNPNHLNMFALNIYALNMFWTIGIQSVHLPPFCRGGVGGGERVDPSTTFSKMEGLTRPQLLEGGCWERGGGLFSGGCNFHIKNRLKSEIFNDK